MLDITNSHKAKLFANALHTYINYDEIAEEAHEKGLVMKESKEFYAFNILSALELKFKGMSKEDIELLITLCSHLDD